MTDINNGWKGPENPDPETIDRVEAPSSDELPATRSRDDIDLTLKAELIRQLDLEGQYGKSIEDLRLCGFLNEDGGAKEGDVPPPSFEQAMSALTPAQLAFARSFQQPAFLLVPKTSFQAKVDAINTHKERLGFSVGYVDPGFEETDSGSEKIEGWRKAIVEGAPVLDPATKCNSREEIAAVVDGQFLRPQFRVQNHERGRHAEDTGTDRHIYAMLIMGSPEFVDKQSKSYLFADRARSKSAIPSAARMSGKVYFKIIDLTSKQECQGGGNLMSNCYFRPCVEGDDTLAEKK